MMQIPIRGMVSPRSISIGKPQGLCFISYANMTKYIIILLCVVFICSIWSSNATVLKNQLQKWIWNDKPEQML